MQRELCVVLCAVCCRCLLGRECVSWLFEWKMGRARFYLTKFTSSARVSVVHFSQEGKFRSSEMVGSWPVEGASASGEVTKRTVNHTP